MINFNRTQNVYVTSDTHFGHIKEFIFNKRGYNSVHEHDTSLLKEINSKVGENDVLIHLGDFCLNTSYSKFELLLESIVCKNIYYIWGNHNSGMKQLYKREVKTLFTRDDIEVYPIRYKNVIFLPAHVDTVIYGKWVVLNHFPIQVWDHMKDGSYMLCGHSHGSLPSTQTASTDGLTLDCGWDLHNKPLHFDEIIAIMDKKVVRKADHHVIA
jgi:calcineurin-like phosphoesterase family protein